MRVISQRELLRLSRQALHFLEGPDLPHRVALNFRASVVDCGTVTSGDLIPLGKLARRLAREQGLDGADAAEEFHKLALECGPSSHQALSIRDSVRVIRSAG